MPHEPPTETTREIEPFPRPDGVAASPAKVLLEELSRHATQDRFVDYHRWSVRNADVGPTSGPSCTVGWDYYREESRIMLRAIRYHKLARRKRGKR
jgi:hypothetical protein